MVGDTAYDVLGAKAHGIPTVGVAWGYGDTAQMLEAGAVKIVEKPQELLQYLRETH
jgi:phosphoglycolate phosphatase